MRKSILDIVQRSHQNRDNVRQEALNALMRWYAVTMHLKLDDDLTLVNLCDEKLPDGSTRWFIEPPVPGQPQLQVVEREFGNDNWQIWTEYEKTVIRSR